MIRRRISPDTLESTPEGDSSLCAIFTLEVLERLRATSQGLISADLRRHLASVVHNSPPVPALWQSRNPDLAECFEKYSLLWHNDRFYDHLLDLTGYLFQDDHSVEIRTNLIEMSLWLTFCQSHEYEFPALPDIHRIQLVQIMSNLARVLVEALPARRQPHWSWNAGAAEAILNCQKDLELTTFERELLNGLVQHGTVTALLKSSPELTRSSVYLSLNRIRAVYEHDGDARPTVKLSTLEKRKLLLERVTAYQLQTTNPFELRMCQALIEAQGNQRQASRISGIAHQTLADFLARKCGYFPSGKTVI